MCFQPSPVKYNKTRQETIARLKYHAATCFYQFILPFGELLAWGEIGQQPDTARPMQGEVWGPGNSTPFKHLSLEYRKHLTWINRDKNRESVWEGVNRVHMQFIFPLHVCGYVVFSYEPFGKQTAQRAADSNSEHGRGDIQMSYTVRGFARGFRIP